MPAFPSRSRPAIAVLSIVAASLLGVCAATASAPAPPALAATAERAPGAAEAGARRERGDAINDGADSAHRPGPVAREIEGWRVLVDPRLLEGPGAKIGARALKALECQLVRIGLLVNSERLEKLRQLEIWIELDNPRLRSMQYHPSVDWLRENGHDERLAKKVHIPHASALLSQEQAAKHPWVVLHELSHAYQDRFVGWENPRLVAAYEKAVKEGRYESVLYIFGGRRRHYALSNQHEYFAEGTEAYFGRNDFYPFVGAELQEHDPTLYDFLKETWGPVR